MTEPTILQYFLGVLTLATAIMTVAGKNPVVSAMSLMGTLFSTGLLYFTLTSYFIGTVQVLIYAGAVSVLFIFIIMLLDLKPRNFKLPGRGITYVLSSIVALGLLVAALSAVLPEMGDMNPINSPIFQDPEMTAKTEEIRAMALEPRAIALRLLSKYMLPFQVTALLLLAAIMGVVVLGKKNMVSVGNSEEKENAGQ